MLGGNIGIHTKRIEIYENERYSPLSGWSSKALLLTDRKALSNRDGSEGYNSLDEANQVLLSFGWQWDESPWVIDKGSPLKALTDEEGWTYSSDFTSFSNEQQEKTNISGIKGVMHFVRRRRLVRDQSFDGKSPSLPNPPTASNPTLPSAVNLICNVIGFSCDHCDLKESERLSNLFLEKFTQATIRRHPRNLTATKANALKNAFIISLQLSDHDLIEKIQPNAVSTSSSTASAPPLKGRSSSLSFFSRSKSVTLTETNKENGEKEDGESLIEKEDATMPAAAVSSGLTAETDNRAGVSPIEESRSTSMSTLNPATLTSLLSKYTVATYSYDKIAELLDAFIQSSSSALSIASSLITTNKNTSEYQDQRTNDINRFYFSKEERMELARLLLRKYDNEYQYHCVTKNCGFACDFRIEQCSNTNCFIQYSHKWFHEHDAICPEKILPCERACGEEIIRKKMNAHLEHTCELRPVVCPYQCVGCSVEGLVARVLPHHIETSTQSHMNNLLERLLEQQRVISTVYSKINDLETVNKTHWHEIIAIQSSVAAAMIAIKASDSLHEKHLADSIKSLDQKVNRVDSNLRHEISKMSAARK